MTKPKSTREKLRNVGPYLFVHENGTYYGIKRVGKKKVIKCLQTNDRPTAQRHLRAWLTQLDEINPATHAQASIAMALEAFIAARSGTSKSTRTSEAGMIAEFRKTFPVAMSEPCHKIRHSHLAQWLALIRPGKAGRTYNRWRLFLMQLCACMERERFVPASPFISKEHKLAKAGRVVRNIPTEAEFQAIIFEIQRPSGVDNKGKHGGQRPTHNQEGAEFAAFLGLAGLGQAEARALRWEDIDFAGDQIVYTRIKTQQPFSTPIYPWLKPLLLQMHERRGFPTGGKVFSILDVKRALMGACRRLKLPHFTQRNLRAMRIKRLWEAGVDVKIIAETQGHRDGGRLIMETYTEVFGSDARTYRDEQLAKATAKTMPLSLLKEAPRA